jgi:hypothetical protein
MKTKNIRNAGLLGAVLLTGLLTGGCIHTTRVTSSPDQNVGQQLLDLDQAYKAGTITESQYNELKNKIIEKNK